MLACLDAAYGPTGVTVACILFGSWTDGVPADELVRRLPPAEPYESGRFYRRELPGLLAVLAALPAPPAVAVVDAHVWLAPGVPGLGGRLYDALGGRTAVVGVAKSEYRGAPAIPVHRGRARAPLYVTAAGLPVEEAVAHVREMHGAFRIPTLLARVDRLSRSGMPGG